MILEKGVDSLVKSKICMIKNKIGRILLAFKNGNEQNSTTTSTVYTMNERHDKIERLTL